MEDGVGADGLKEVRAAGVEDNGIRAEGLEEVRADDVETTGSEQTVSSKWWTWKTGSEQLASRKCERLA